MIKQTFHSKPSFYEDLKLQLTLPRLHDLVFSMSFILCFFISTTASAQGTLLFRTEFGNGQSHLVTDGENYILQQDDMADGPSDFDTDLPNYVAHVGEMNIKTEYVDNTVEDKVSIVIDDIIVDGVTMVANANVLRFRVEDIMNMGSSDPENDDVRIQAQVHHNDAYRQGGDMAQSALQHFTFIQNLLIPLDFAWLLSEEQEGTNLDFFTVAEFFNSPEISGDDFGGNAFRIGLELVKPAGDRFFHFLLDGCPREQVNGVWKWNDASDDAYNFPENITESVSIGLPYTDSDGNLHTPDILLGEWMGFVLTMKEGGEGEGHFNLTLRQSQMVTAIDQTTHTKHLNDDIDDGFDFIQPMKLYAKRWVIDGFEGDNVCQLFFHDPCILKTRVNDFTNNPGGADCAGIIDGSFDAHQKPGDPMDMGDITNPGVRLGDYNAGIMFKGFAIPAGATIESAFIEFTGRTDGQSGAATIPIRGLMEDDPFSASGATIKDRFDNDQSAGDLLGDADIIWIIQDDDIWNENEIYYSEDISGMIQRLLNEKTDGDGISPDEWINILFLGNEDYARRTGHSFDDEPDKAPRLCVTFSGMGLQGDIVYQSQSSAVIDGISVSTTPTSEDPCLEGAKQTTVVDNHFEQPICEQAAEYTIQPTKTTDPFCGLDVRDVVRICRHVTGVAPIQNAYERIAADVNRDGLITMDDAYELRYAIISSTPLPKPWTFVADDEPFDDNYPGVPIYSDIVEGEYTNSIDNELDFDLIKIGDVNSSCRFGQPYYDEISLKVPPDSKLSNQIFDMPLNTSGFTNINAFQLGLSFDSSVLEFQGLGTISTGADGYWYVTEPAAGQLQILWNDEDCDSYLSGGSGTSLEDGETVFNLNFKSLTNVDNVATAISIDNSILTSEMYSGNRLFNLALEDKIAGGRSSEETEIVARGSKVECYPNPVTEVLQLQLQLATATPVNVIIHDALGKVLLEKEYTLDAGVQQLSLKEISKWHTGLYLYTIDIGQERHHGSFVKSAR